MNENTKTEAKKPSKPHTLELAEHKLLAVTGVKAVPVFTDKTINVELEGETLTVAGHDLSVKSLDVETGFLSVTGYVTMLKYSSETTPASFMKKLFK